MDAGPRAGVAVRVAREALRTNQQLAPVDALLLAADAVDAARARGIASGFLAATLLQESAFDPRAISAAGAVGIAQFTVPTARIVGVDPWQPDAAIDACAALLARYTRRYAAGGVDPYGLAAAAYNAGPLAVAAYGGIPPYPETRAYVQDIRERWSRIVGR